MERFVYHGSPQGDLPVLKARKGTHQKECIYATDSEAVALLFMGKGRGDLDVMIATIDGMLSLVERRPGILKQLYDKSGFLYELDGRTFEHYDYLWSREVISFESELAPLRCILIPNILEAIQEQEQNGALKVYRYPDRPLQMPLDNSDLIDEYISMERKGCTGVVGDLLEVYPEFSDIVREKMKGECKR